MMGCHLDPALLARREADPNHDPHRAAGAMLRDYLGGGDIFAEVRERVRRDPQLRAMIQAARQMLAPVGDQTPRCGRRRARRPRRLR